MQKPTAAAPPAADADKNSVGVTRPAVELSMFQYADQVFAAPSEDVDRGLREYSLPAVGFTGMAMNRDAEPPRLMFLTGDDGVAVLRELDSEACQAMSAFFMRMGVLLRKEVNS